MASFGVRDAYIDSQREAWAGRFARFALDQKPRVVTFSTSRRFFSPTDFR